MVIQFSSIAIRRRELPSTTLKRKSLPSGFGATTMGTLNPTFSKYSVKQSDPELAPMLDT
jgi:hypothetical protein